MARGRRAGLSEAERADWASYARFVRPLPGRTVPEFSPEPAPETPVRVAPAPLRPAPAPLRTAAHLSVGLAPGGLDRATWERFRSGRMKAERTLDLHGMTADRAHHALHRFMHAAHGDGVRCVEVITGRGGSGPDGQGVIRRELPLWLNLPQLRPLVLAAAHPHAANPGSTRLLLRRARR